jgi:hypothetical protein
MNLVMEFGKKNMKWIVTGVATIAVAAAGAFAAKKSGKLDRFITVEKTTDPTEEVEG